MELGRNFTNLLYFNYLSDDEVQKLISGDIEPSDVDALVQIEAKRDIIGQIEAAEEWDLDHVELDGAVPNPYLDFDEEQKQKVREKLNQSEVSLSLHLPYTYVASCLCAPMDRDRKIASDLLKRYIDFANEIDCKYVNAHPGSVPFYHSEGKYRDRVRDNLIKSLIELGGLASDNGISFHIENNVASHMVFVEPEDLIEAVEEVRSEGVDVFFNFDIGHWFTRANFGKEIPTPPEDVIKKLPEDMVKELHLNDYIPEERVFHPPLHDQSGLLLRSNIERYAELVEEKGAELIVVETAFRDLEQIKNRDKVIREETDYLKEIFE